MDESEFEEGSVSWIGPTPGPWYDDGYRIHAPCDGEDKRDGRVIVEYKHVDHFNSFDAPLIAGAPDLLEALIAVRDELEDKPFTDYENFNLEQVRAAIAKATGQAASPTS